ncbi:MAG: hypothetical protein EXR99_09010 [Gemmataceae bacterium]|nr:hypothetical protein [Gemmataceae bacterium]
MACLRLALFALAAARYPGGYDWTHHFVSALFQPTALNGDQNPARQPAILAVFMFCVSMGAVLWNCFEEGKVSLS